MEETSLLNEKSNNITEKNVFLKIWTSPREVLKYINETNYDKYFYLLLFLSGISRGFDRASMRNMGDQMPLIGIIGLSIGLGGLLGWISFYFYSALLSWTGKWLKGVGDTKSIFRILAYSMIPSIIGLLFLIPQIAIYGNEVFKSDGDITSAGLVSNLIYYCSLVIEFILGIWTMVLCVIGISEVQKLSIGKTILNIFLPVMIILIPILTIALLIRGFN